MEMKLEMEMEIEMEMEMEMKLISFPDMKISKKRGEYIFYGEIISLE